MGGVGHCAASRVRDCISFYMSCGAPAGFGHSPHAEGHDLPFVLGGEEQGCREAP